MKTKDITILISTISGRLSGARNVVQSINDDSVKIIIVIQKRTEFNTDDKISLEYLKSQKNIKIIISMDTGVTKSRNLALSYLKTDYAIFSDDDIIYSKNFLPDIVNSFNHHKNAAFLTFNVVDENNNPLKKYPLETLKHTRFSILKVGTIEIAINRKLSNNITFPDDMGAGSQLFCCDEPVYLGRYINNGLIGYHIPKTICFHPKDSSGKNLKSKKALLSRYICFNRIFGKFLGTPLFILFIIKNITKII